MSWYRWEADALVLELRVLPRSSRDALGEISNERLKLKITAPPVDGKANEKVTRFLARAFGVAPTCVSIIRGELSRDKTVRIQAPSRLPTEIRRLIEPRRN